MLNLKLKQLLTVIGAHDTYLATDHLSVTARTKVIDQLIEKLTPLGDDNHAYACWILSIIHPHKQVWLEKAAALGNVEALSALLINAGLIGASIEVQLDLLVRYIKFIDAYHLKTGQTEVAPAAWVTQFGFSKYAALFDKKFTACTLSEEELQTTHTPNMQIEPYIFPKTRPEHDFIEAIIQGKLNVVTNYLAAGGNPLLYTKESRITGLSTLCLAIKYNHLVILKVLIEAYQQYGLSIVSALDYAKTHNKNESVEALLDAGIDPRIRYTAGQHPMIDKFIKQRRETLTLHAITLVKEPNGEMSFESYDNCRIAFDPKSAKSLKRAAVNNESFMMGALPCKHPITQSMTPTKAFDAKLNYEMKAFNGYDDHDEVLLTITSNVFKRGHHPTRPTSLIHLAFCDYFTKNLIDYLKQKSLDSQKFIRLLDPIIPPTFTFPRDYCNVILDFIFELHQNHLCAITSEKQISALTLCQGLSEPAVTRINAMTSSYLPNATFPHLYDVSYVQLIKPMIDAKERMIYRCYAELRKLAWVLSSAMFAKMINLTSDVLIYIAAFTHDNSVFNHAEAITIVTPCFNRPMTSTYTPRLFLPAAAPPASSLLVCVKQMCLNLPNYRK